MINTNYKIFASYLYIIFVSLFLTSCASVPNEQRIDNLPMYGQPEIPRPEYMQKADEEFIKQAAAGFGGDRHKASIAWHTEAEKYMEQNNIHYAMRRYNQSWLLDPDNYLPYWGFGRIMLEREDFDKAIQYFEKANSLIDDPYQKPALLSDTAVAFTMKGYSISDANQVERDSYYNAANKLFEESSNLDPSYKEIWRRWAFSLYYQGNYEEAWVKVKKSRFVNALPLPSSFIQELSAKMPEPE